MTSFCAVVWLLAGVWVGLLGFGLWEAWRCRGGTLLSVVAQYGRAMRSAGINEEIPEVRRECYRQAKALWAKLTHEPRKGGASVVCLRAALFCAIVWTVLVVTGIALEHIYGHICVSRCAFGNAESATRPQNWRKPLILNDNLVLRKSAEDPQRAKGQASRVRLCGTHLYIAC